MSKLGGCKGDDGVIIFRPLTATDLVLAEAVRMGYEEDDQPLAVREIAPGIWVSRLTTVITDDSGDGEFEARC